jgi:hypothetical protein
MWERTPEQIEKDHQAAEMKALGHTYSEIGAVYGITRQAASLMVQRAMDETPVLGGEQYKNLVLLQLDAIESKAAEIARTSYPVVAPSGKIVTRVVETPEGLREVEVHDPNPTLKALETLLKVSERRARLLGLNAPTNVRVEAVAYDPDAIDAELVAFRAILAGVGDSETVLDGQEG